MSYTKGELVNSALEEIGIAEYEFDVSPEQVQSAVRRLDSMLAEWNARGLALSSPLSERSAASPDQVSNIPDWAIEAVILNLAIRIAPSYGRVVSNETRSSAKHAYITVCGKFAQPKEMQFPSMPKGAGYKTTEFRYTPEPEDQYLRPIDEEFNPSGGPDGM